MNIGATIGLNSSFLEGWDESTDVANAKHVIFFSNSITKTVLKTENRSNHVVFEFLFHICNLFMSKQRFSPEQGPNPPPSRFLAMATRREPCFEP